MPELRIEYPPGGAAYIPSYLIDVQLPGLTVLKLKNVVVDESALLHVLSNHSKTLEIVDFKGVHLVMTDYMRQSLGHRTYDWTNIIRYMSILPLRAVQLIQLGWKDQNDESIIRSYIHMPQAKYHERSYDADGEEYWKLKRSGLYAQGSRAIKDGLEKMIIEAHKRAKNPKVTDFGYERWAGMVVEVDSSAEIEMDEEFEWEDVDC